MSINKGNLAINSIYQGNTPIKKVYAGDSLVFQHKDAISLFIDNCLPLGGDEELIRSCYNNIDEEIKEKASVLLFPSVVTEGVIYGMNNRTGGLVPFTFSRKSEATYFDKNLDLQLVNNDTPRIDFCNYSNDAKILIEKESTNFLRDSNFELNLDTVGSKYKVVDETFGILSKKVDLVSGSYYYKKWEKDSEVMTSLSSLIRTDLPKLTTADPKSVGLIVLTTDAFYNPKLRSLKNDIYLIEGSRMARGNINEFRNNGFVRYTTQKDGYMSSLYLQLEKSDYSSSYIPTTTTTMTRSVDNLQTILTTNSKVYIKTTKEEKYIDRTAGEWNIQEDITESDGIICLAIFNE